MNSPLSPLSPVLRCLAILPAVIMVADYALLTRATVSKNPPARTTVVTPAPGSYQLAEAGTQSVKLTPKSDRSF